MFKLHCKIHLILHPHIQVSLGRYSVPYIKGHQGINRNLDKQTARPHIFKAQHSFLFSIHLHVMDSS